MSEEDTLRAAAAELQSYASGMSRQSIQTISDIGMPTLARVIREFRDAHAAARNHANCAGAAKSLSDNPGENG